MNLLIATVGLPRSGKSTWAKGIGFPIVCPDAIRLACHARAYFAPFEPWTWALAYTMCEALFQAGHEHVIFDSTAINRKRRDALRLQGDVFGEHPDMRGWSVAFKTFDADSDTCTRRADESGRPDLIPIIARMAFTAEPLEPDERVYGIDCHEDAKETTP